MYDPLKTFTALSTNLTRLGKTRCFTEYGEDLSFLSLYWQMAYPFLQYLVLKIWVFLNFRGCGFEDSLTVDISHIFKWSGREDAPPPHPSTWLRRSALFSFHPEIFGRFFKLCQIAKLSRAGVNSLLIFFSTLKICAKGERDVLSPSWSWRRLVVNTSNQQQISSKVRSWNLVEKLNWPMLVKRGNHFFFFFFFFFFFMGEASIIDHGSWTLLPNNRSVFCGKPHLPMLVKRNQRFFIFMGEVVIIGHGCRC